MRRGNQAAQARNRAIESACLACNDLIAIAAQAAYLAALLAKCQRAMLTLSRGNRTGATAYRSDFARRHKQHVLAISNRGCDGVHAGRDPELRRRTPSRAIPAATAATAGAAGAAAELFREALPGAWGPMPRAQGITISQRPSPGRSTPTRSCGGTSMSTNRR